MAFFRMTPLIAAFLLSSCASDDEPEVVEFARPETAVDYEVVVEGSPSEEVTGLIETSLALYRNRDRGAQSLAFLRRRAQGDVETLGRLMRAYGYYEAEFETRVEEPVEDGGPATAVVVIEPGRPFVLARHEFRVVDDGGAAPELSDPAALGSPVGAPATAAEIVDAEAAAVAELRGEGRPYAERGERDSVADPATAEIEVDSIISAGPEYAIGPVLFDGLERVQADYLLTYRPWEEGARFDAGLLTAFQRDLVGTGLFGGASVTPPDVPPEGDAVPILVRVEEAPRRTVSAGLRFDTDAGPAVRVGYENRNLFGRNEILNLDAEAGTEEQRVEARLRRPQWRRDGQDLIGGVELRRIDDEAFEELGFTAGLGIERELSDTLTVGTGGLVEISQIDGTEDDDGLATLVGAPSFAAVDTTDDRLDPSRGARARASLTPFVGAFDGEPTGFFTIDLTGSTYYDITGERDYILAARARIASILALDEEDVPAQRRLFSGGGGSVRGFEERFIGPLDGDGDPEGGLSAAELGVELRARVLDEVGIAVFAEGGTVSESIVPDLEEGFQVAVGAGVRYFSPIGPIRVDVGFPVNPRDEDEFFQFYISIGQAF